MIVGAIQGVKAMKADQIKTGFTRDQVKKAIHMHTYMQTCMHACIYAYTHA